MAIAFVKNGGVAANKATAGPLSVTVPAGGHAIGNLVVVNVGWSSTSTLATVLSRTVAATPTRFLSQA